MFVGKVLKRLFPRVPCSQEKSAPVTPASDKAAGRVAAEEVPSLTGEGLAGAGGHHRFPGDSMLWSRRLWPDSGGAELQDACAHTFQSTALGERSQGWALRQRPVQDSARCLGSLANPPLVPETTREPAGFVCPLPRHFVPALPGCVRTARAPESSPAFVPHPPVFARVCLSSSSRTRVCSGALCSAHSVQFVSKSNHLSPQKCRS